MIAMLNAMGFYSDNVLTDLFTLIFIVAHINKPGWVGHWLVV